MKKPKMPRTLKEINERIAELREGIEEEKAKILEEERELKLKKEDIEAKIRIRVLTIEEYTFLLKYYQKEREYISNPSSRRNGNKCQEK